MQWLPQLLQNDPLASSGIRILNGHPGSLIRHLEPRPCASPPVRKMRHKADLGAHLHPENELGMHRNVHSVLSESMASLRAYQE